ncbi:hypothetical protein KC341_g85 [Hortaea werneckii]|nr:hypothetical protein KC341_g85 [Hortaea werneckii]
MFSLTTLRQRLANGAASPYPEVSNGVFTTRQAFPCGFSSSLCGIGIESSCTTDACGSDFEIHIPILHENPSKNVLVVADGNDRLQDEIPRAYHARMVCQAVSMLPPDPAVLLPENITKIHGLFAVLKPTLKRHFCHETQFPSVTLKLGPSGCVTCRGFKSVLSGSSRMSAWYSLGTHSSVKTSYTGEKGKG